LLQCIVLGLLAIWDKKSKEAKFFANNISIHEILCYNLCRIYKQKIGRKSKINDNSK